MRLLTVGEQVNPNKVYAILIGSIAYVLTKVGSQYFWKKAHMNNYHVRVFDSKADAVAWAWTVTDDIYEGDSPEDIIYNERLAYRSEIQYDRTKRVTK